MDINKMIDERVDGRVAKRLAEWRCACQCQDTGVPSRTHYTAREVAESLGLTYRTVVALTGTVDIPSRRFGKHIRIPATWIREQLGEPEPPQLQGGSTGRTVATSRSS